MSDEVIVTGATGAVGRHVVAGLVAAGVAVRAVTRNPAAAAFGPDVEVVAGDLTEPPSLDLTAAAAAFLLWPSFAVGRAAELVDALARHVRHVVHLSAEAAAADPGSVWAQVERLVRGSRAEWTVLRPTGFATNTLGWADQIRAHGVVRGPYGAAARSLIDQRDIAAVAVRALVGDGHAGRTHVLSGPEALTQAEQARLIGEALGRPVRWVEVPRERARADLLDAFGDPDVVESALDTWAGFVTEPECVTTTVADLTGTPARTFARWATDHVGAFR